METDPGFWPAEAFEGPTEAGSASVWFGLPRAFCSLVQPHSTSDEGGEGEREL